MKVNGADVGFANGPRATNGESRLTSMTSRVEGQDVIVEAKYDGVLRLARWRVRSNGWLTLDYQLRMPGGPHPFFGITFEYPADRVTDVRWLGHGPYRVWKNRLDGPPFDVWSSTANDAVTGEVWQYPEFAGPSPISTGRRSAPASSRSRPSRRPRGCSCACSRLANRRTRA